MSGRALRFPGRVEALLFDLGGVVIDIDFGRAFEQWARRASCDPIELRDRFCFDAAYEEHERSRLDINEYFQAVRQLLSLDLSDEDLLAGWNDIYLDVLPGVHALLSNASSRFPVDAFTNSNAAHHGVWSSRFAQELSVFRSVYISCELGVRKPDREAFLAVADLMAVEPSAVLFFDDSMENVEGAEHAGMQAVLVESTDDVRQALRQVGCA